MLVNILSQLSSSLHRCPGRVTTGVHAINNADINGILSAYFT